MNLFSSKKMGQLPNHRRPSHPYFLKADSLFARKNGKEIFIKKIYSLAPGIPDMGSVIMAPGIATNANLFRVDDRGKILHLDHNRSFANLLASQGFAVYLYHPGYTERTHNRYVCRHCRDSRHYGKRYKAPSTLSFQELAEEEVPMVIDFVRQNSGRREKQISWIGYSMGGMLIYSYLSKYDDNIIKNVITIGSPLSLSQIFIRVIPYTNMASKAMGFEERSFLGVFFENLVPLTRLIRMAPGWLLRYNLMSMLLCNPLNITTTTLKTLIGRVVEPIPSTLEMCFANIIHSGHSCEMNYANYLENLQQLRNTEKNFLFFFGPNDVIAPPDSIYLAHEIISPGASDNLVPVPSAGHLDMIVGKNSKNKVWIPAMEWLRKNSDAEKREKPYYEI